MRPFVVRAVVADPLAAALIVAVAVAVAVAGAACDSRGSTSKAPPASGGAPGAAGDPSGAAGDPTGAAGAPADRLLTAAALLDARGLVRPSEPWGEAAGRLERKLGAPSVTDGDELRWAVADGEACVGLFVERRDGQVGAIVGPSRMERSDYDAFYQKCAAALGGAAIPVTPVTPVAPVR